MKVLLLEDDRKLRSELGHWLRRSRYAVDEAETLRQLRELLPGNAYDCLIFDRLVPDGDSLDILSQLRRRGDETPVLFISCQRTDSGDRAHGLLAGGDDYMVKPLARDEFLARVHVVCRRSAPRRPVVLRVGDLTVDTARWQVHRNGAPVELTAREFSVLALLASRAGDVVRRSELIERCWGEHEMPMSNTVDVHVNHLRRKLGWPLLIRTVRGVGYSLGPSTW